MPEVHATKILQNTELSLYQDADLTQLENYYEELKELISLFADKADSPRLKSLEKHLREYDLKFKPQIKEAKRLLKNTRSRLHYNASHL